MSQVSPRPLPEAVGAYAAEQLLPDVYARLRRMAAARLARERPGQRLDATELVHETYLRLTRGAADRRWESHAHFLAAAADAMGRVVVSHARRRQAAKRGGHLARADVDPALLPDRIRDDMLMALDEALRELQAADPVKAQLVCLRYLYGLTTRDAAELLGFSTATANRYWVYARAWLQARLTRDEH